jgi:hypothetical protein
MRADRERGIAKFEYSCGNAPREPLRDCSPCGGLEANLGHTSPFSDQHVLLG